MPQHTPPATAELVAFIDSRIDSLLLRPAMYGSAGQVESSVLCLLEIRSFALGNSRESDQGFDHYRRQASAAYNLGALTVDSVVTDVVEMAALLKTLVDACRLLEPSTVDPSNAFPPMPVPGLPDWIIKARPMSTYDELLREAREQRYRPGTGPWSKEEDLDQVDLVDFDKMTKNYRFLSDERGLLSCCVRRLVEEVRRAKKYPTPPEITPVYEYKKSEVEPMKERVCSAFGFEQDGNKGEEEQ